MIFALATVIALVSAEGPCDIYGKAGTPCVAAHSMTRALYGAYRGPLYSVKYSTTHHHHHHHSLQSTVPVTFTPPPHTRAHHRRAAC